MTANRYRIPMDLNMARPGYPSAYEISCRVRGRIPRPVSRIHPIERGLRSFLVLPLPHTRHSTFASVSGIKYSISRGRKYEEIVNAGYLFLLILLPNLRTDLETICRKAAQAQMTQNDYVTACCLGSRAVWKPENSKRLTSKKRLYIFHVSGSCFQTASLIYCRFAANALHSRTRKTTDRIPTSRLDSAPA